MSKEQNHGLFGAIIKIVMVIIFFLIGATTLTIGCIGHVNNWFADYRWINIVNIVFGVCLLTSPYFMNKKHQGLSKVIRILLIIIFVLIGITYIVVGSIAVAKNLYPEYRWYPIMNIVLGCLLFTSPYFLKKDA